MGGLGLVKDMWKACSTVIKDKALHQSVILIQSMQSPLLSPLVAQCLISHYSWCDLGHMEAMFQMVDTGMDSNMY